MQQGRRAHPADEGGQLSAVPRTPEGRARRDFFTQRAGIATIPGRGGVCDSSGRASSSGLAITSVAPVCGHRDNDVR